MRLTVTLFLSMLMVCCPILAQRNSVLVQKMVEMGYLNLKELDPTLVVDLMYSRADNFTGVVLYTNLTEAYLYPTAAKAVVKAQEALHKLHPDYNLKICDASRPMSVQKKMYDVVRGTPKNIYVSNPANGGGLHNYGMAVDVTIVDKNGKELDMGTKVDHLGKEAHINTETALVQAGTITAQAKKNRELLRRVMREAGFKPLQSEWWHFNFVTRAEAKAKYKVLDF